MEDSARMQFKVVVLGIAGVGKKSMLKYYTGQLEPLKTEVNSSLTGTYFRKQLDVNGTHVTLDLWNVNPHQLDTRAPFYYVGADACVFVFDLSVREAVVGMELWRAKFFGDFNYTLAPGVPTEDTLSMPCAAVGNKMDKLQAVSTEEITKWVERHGLPFFRTCAVSETGCVGLDDVFNDLAQRCVKRELQRRQQATEEFSASVTAAQSKRWCPGWCPGLGCNMFCNIL